MLLNCGVGENSWKSLGLQEIQPVNPKGNQPRVFIGKTDAEAETLILWPPDVKDWLIGKDPDAGKNWRQEQKGTTEDEMVGWHHQLSGHEFAQAPGVGDGQGSLMCCSPWGLKELDMTEQLNWTEPIASPVKSRGNRTSPFWELKQKFVLFFPQLLAVCQKSLVLLDFCGITPSSAFIMTWHFLCICLCLKFLFS